MEPAKRFLEYAAAFEQSYADDDWTRLEEFFTEDASYVTAGEPPLGGRYDGREQLLAGFRASVEDLDRRFDARRVEMVGTPKVAEDTFEMRWRATYEKKGCPDLVVEGSECATFEGDRIRLLEDVIAEGTDTRIQEYMQRYFG